MGRPGHKTRFLDDEFHWLEQALTPRVTVTRCCPKCQRGSVPGQFPCGRPGACPNPNCEHSRR